MPKRSREEEELREEFLQLGKAHREMMKSMIRFHLGRDETFNLWNSTELWHIRRACSKGRVLNYLSQFGYRYSRKGRYVHMYDDSIPSVDLSSEEVDLCTTFPPQFINYVDLMYVYRPRVMRTTNGEAGTIFLE